MYVCACAYVKHTLASSMNRPPRVFTCSMLVFFAIIFMYMLCKEKVLALIPWKVRQMVNPGKDEDKQLQLHKQSVSFFFVFSRDLKSQNLGPAILRSGAQGLKDTGFRGEFCGVGVCDSIWLPS